MTQEMIEEPNNESEVESDALIELVDSPAPRSHAPAPPPLNRPAPPSQSSSAEPRAPDPPPPSPSSASSPSSSSPPAGRLSSLPVAPPRPGTPSVNPIGGNLPSQPPRSSSFPRVPPPPPAPAAMASAAPPAVVERTPLVQAQEQLEAARRALLSKDAELRTLLAQRDASIAELESVSDQVASRQL